MNTFFTYVLPLSIVFTGIYLSFWTEILRDARSIPTESYRKIPYSYARTQLMWWSLIIIPCFCSYYGINHQIGEINSSSLVLLGISVGTVASARIIDNTDISNNVSRHQDNATRGFLIDIISDENGISVHRFQALVFNLVFGIMFISKFISNNTYIEFGDRELTLMGISSVAYVGLKISENGKNVQPAQDVSGQSQQ